MDDLHTRTFDVLVDPAWEHGIGAAIDIALLTRFYEHYADHAVAVARRIVFIVTGHMPGRRLLPAGADPVGR